MNFPHIVSAIGKAKQSNPDDTVSHLFFWIASAVFIAALAGCLIWDSYDQRDICSRLENIETELDSYRSERNDLRYQIRDLNAEYTSKINGKGTVEIVFTDIGESVYSDAYPQMKKQGFTGCLALSDTQLPGKSGCMSKKHFNELVENGWSVCLIVKKKSNAGRQLKKAADALADKGISLPDTVIFASGTYSEGYKSVLEGLGFTTVIHHGEDNLKLITYDYSSEITEFGAAGWNASLAKQRLTHAISYGGNIVFTVGEDCAYSKDTFAKMLSQIADYVSDGKLYVKSPGDAAQYHRNVYKNSDSVEQELDEKTDELETRINEIDSEMRAVYAKYGW